MYSDIIDDAVRTIQARLTSDLARIAEAADLAEQADHLFEKVVIAAAAAGHRPYDIDAALRASTRGAQQPRPAGRLSL